MLHLASFSINYNTFQLAIVCLSFAEYVVESFTDECAPTPIAIKVVCLTCIGK